MNEVYTTMQLTELLWAYNNYDNEYYLNWLLYIVEVEVVSLEQLDAVANDSGKLDLFASYNIVSSIRRQVGYILTLHCSHPQYGGESILLWGAAVNYFRLI